MKVALIGYGPAGAVLHAPLISSTVGLELAAIVTGDPARRAAAATAHPGAAILANASDVAPGAFDLVVIATPVRSHVPLAERAIEAGMAVVVDKPLAASSADGRRLVERAAARGVPLTVFQNRRWDSDFLTVQGVVERGLVGRLHRFESRFEGFRPVDAATWQESADPADGGGVLLDLGSHLVDQVMTLLGRPTSVWAEIHRRRPGAAVDDDAFLVLGFADDVTAQLSMSRAVHASGPSFRIAGAAAAFEIDGADPQWGALADGLRPGGPTWGRHPEWGVLTGADGDVETVRRIRPRRGSWERFYTGVRDALQAGGPLPVDPRDAVDVLRVIETARRSAEHGRRLPIASRAPRSFP